MTTRRLRICFVLAAALTAPTFVLTVSCSSDENHGGKVTASSRDCGAGLRVDPPAVGLSCIAADGAAPESDAGIADDCRVPRTLSGTELIAGFGVPEFEQFNVLVPDASPGVSVEWMAGDSTWVQCAVFACRPEFERANGSMAISTFGRCVIAHESVDARRRSLDLTRLPRLTTPKARELQELAVGCWAYDDTNVVAASRLERIPLDRAKVFTGTALVASCNDGTGDRACVLAPDSPLGFCDGTVCRARCKSDDDCAVLAPSIDAGAPLATEALDASVEDAATLDSGADAADAASPVAEDAGDGGVADAGPGNPIPTCEYQCTRLAVGDFGICRPISRVQSTESE